MTSMITSRTRFLKDISSCLHSNFNFIQVCGYAARKGFREKVRRNKVKKEVLKVGFIPHNLRDKGKSKGPVLTKRVDDSYKQEPIDNVYPQRFFRWKVYDFEDAVQCHRETHHPQIYNLPNAYLRAFIELDMTGPKKTKFVEMFTRMAKVDYPFDHGENRSILVFCKNLEGKNDAELAGASLVADSDTTKKIEKGDLVLPDFDFVMAHPDILPEITCLRGLLKKKFPNAKTGTLGTNIGELVKTFRSGIYYKAVKDEAEPAYGYIETIIGTLDMDVKHLKSNFISLLNDVSITKPKRPGPFITGALLKCEPSFERLKLNITPLLEEDESESDSDSDDEVDRVKARA